MRFNEILFFLFNNSGLATLANEVSGGTMQVINLILISLNLFTQKHGNRKIIIFPFIFPWHLMSDIEMVSIVVKRRWSIKWQLKNCLALLVDATRSLQFASWRHDANTSRSHNMTPCQAQDTQYLSIYFIYLFNRRYDYFSFGVRVGPRVGLSKMAIHLGLASAALPVTNIHCGTTSDFGAV